MAHLLLSAVVNYHSNLDAFKSAHVFAQLLDSPSFNAEVLRNTAADSDAAADCLCPGTTLLYRLNGRCKCIENHFKREVAPVSKLSSTSLKPAVTTSKSSATVAKVSLTAPKLSITEHSTVVNTTALNTNPVKTTVVKPTVAKITGQTTTAEPTTAKPTTAKTTDIKTPAVKNPVPIEPVDDVTVLPVLLHPVLVCFSGSCFASTELSKLEFVKRNLNSVVHSANASRVCASKDVTVCVQGQCYCRIARRTTTDSADGQDSIFENCPSNHTLICHSTSCSCDETRPTPGDPNTEVLDPTSCHFGAPVCFESLCYCPLRFEARLVESTDQSMINPVACPEGKPLVCFHNECFCYIGSSRDVQPSRQRQPLYAAVYSVPALALAPAPPHSLDGSRSAPHTVAPIAGATSIAKAR
jgi:hypothetical protein